MAQARPFWKGLIVRLNFWRMRIKHPIKEEQVVRLPEVSGSFKQKKRGHASDLDLTEMMNRAMGLELGEEIYHFDRDEIQNLGGKKSLENQRHTSTTMQLSKTSQKPIGLTCIGILRFKVFSNAPTKLAPIPSLNSIIIEANAPSIILQNSVPLFELNLVFYIIVYAVFISTCLQYKIKQ